MNDNIDKNRLKELWIEMLKEIGENIYRKGIKDTPERIANMYGEIFKGYNINEKPVITTFSNGEDGITYNQMIIDEGNFYSLCEHHCMPFFGKYWFSYIPHKHGKIMGISKVARVIDFHSSKLQTQERLVKDIIDDLWSSITDKNYSPRGMALVIKARHLCKAMRGIKQEGEMTTIELKGLFKEDPKTRQEFFSFIHMKNG